MLQGRVTGFIGPNGAGKTTTLRVLLGLVAPTSGSTTIEGREYRDLRDPLRTVGAVLEGSGFHPGRTARNHLRAVAVAASIPVARLDDVLQQVGMLEFARDRVGGYSLGMRQRLALAQALLGDPRVLVLDEPANGLDPEGIRWLRRFLRALADEGRTVLVSSHVLSEVAQTAHDVVVIDRGRLVAHSAVDALTAGRLGSVRLRTPDASRFAELLLERGMSCDLTAADSLVVREAASLEVGTVAADHRIRIAEMVGEAPSLEDVFLDLTGTSSGAR